MPASITPLVPITVASIYNNGPLPSRMAKCTPDTAAAIQAVVGDLRGLGHELRLSDLFRSREMQQQAYLDYKEGRKRAEAAQRILRTPRRRFMPSWMTCAV